MINFFKYNKSYAKNTDSIINSLTSIVNSGNFINGSEVDIFEESVSRYLSIDHFRGVSSGTDALIVAIMASVKKKRGNFIVPSFTFTATAMSPVRLGYKVKFVDVEVSTFKPAIQSIIDACDKNTVGVIWPYLFGEPTDIEVLYNFCKERDIVLIEDCAQSLGTKIGDKFAGNISHAGCFSFFPTKNLGAFGDAGGVATSHDDIHEKVKKIKSHGYYDQKYNSTIIGGNFRLDTIQAAILTEIFKNFDNLLKQRKSNALFYEQNINNRIIKKPEFSKGHSWNQYCLIVDNNEKFKNYLLNNGIQSNIYYPFPLHKNPVFDTGLSLINTEDLCSKIIAIPIYPGLEKSSLLKIVEVVNKYE
jgi:UDP-2-acetamido-2-deoxy-ribo-hexuluronate aminotransferase